MNNKLPPCHLIESLREKAKTRTDVEFDYISQLNNLRNRVGGEVRFINQLFPEYTPHDEEYHLSRLFHVADTLIGQDRYEGMNATELLVLGCGLYTHDWGMAVSEAERDYIVSGKLSEGFSPSDFALLPDEHSKFDKFVKERRLDPDALKKDGISNDDWREYVRRTHAFRSGERARLYFRNIDSGLAEAVGRVAEGHWLDIETLHDYQRFPPDFAVLRENINLAALAVYVRLVDLLDIGHDRTPYIIWKFVAPRDRRSQMEWNKHRALQPITCSAYQNGRVILVDGSTDDHEVYAALEDLRIYCNTQLRECTDLLARLNDPRHLLDIYHIEWRVAARGFDPVPIRFEFDRNRVFEILSDEIYQGDPYVFLRELLQNSIDAIRTRREILKKHVSGMFTSFGLIRVEVEHGENVDVRVRWTDDGIGMDDYTVRNYLAVAGRSYYRSEEFEKLNLALDPISKFGIGILSCFMAADRVEIETHRDPYAFSPSDPLRIKIPSVTRQFRVEKCSPHDLGIGTTVTVYVDGRRLPKDSEPLDVTKYLKIVAGFVEFPILISEHGKHTLILHPYSDINPSLDPRFQSYGKIETHRISLEYPLEEAVLPQDLENARAELTVKSFDLRDDLGLTNYEGRISFLEFRDKTKLIRREFPQGVHVSCFDNTDSKIIRWEDTWNIMRGYFADTSTSFSKSANPHPTHAVYRDGVLVSNVRLEGVGYLGHGSFPVQRQVINFKSGSASEVDVARSQLRTDEELWYNPIKEALNREVWKRLRSDMHELNRKERLRRFGLFISTYHLTANFLLSLPLHEIPVSVITSKGGFEVRTWDTFNGEPVRTFPRVLGNELTLLFRSIFSQPEYKGLLTAWAGDDSLIVESESFHGDLAIDTSLAATRILLKKYYYLAAVCFLEPPSKKMPPLVQEIWHPLDTEISRPIDDIAEQAVDNPLDLSEQERKFLLSQAMFSWENYYFVVFPNQVRFPFRVGSHLFNISHPAGTLLFRSIAWLILAQKRGKRGDARAGRLQDAVQFVINNTWSSEPIDFEVDTSNLYQAAFEAGLLKSSSPVTTIKPDELWYSSWESIGQWNNLRKSFGQVIKS